MCLFLSKILIHKTVKYNPEKYFEILMDLIEFNKDIKHINYGLEEKMVEEFHHQLGSYSPDFG